MQLEVILLSVFSATIDEPNGTPIITDPEKELELGTLLTGETHHVFIMTKPETTDGSLNESAANHHQSHSLSSPPPVREGEQLDVEIEDVREEGDGIASVGPGYVIFVPDADVGDRVIIEATKTRDKFGFGDVVILEPVNG